MGSLWLDNLFQRLDNLFLFCGPASGGRTVPEFRSRTVYAEWLVSAFESRGIAATDIASVSGIGTELLEGQAPRLPLEDYLRLLNWAAIRCDDPWLGLHLGSEFDVEQFGIFGYLLRHSTTLRNLCEVASEYIATISPAIALDFLPGMETSRMEYRILVPVREESRQDIDHSLASVAAIFRSHLGPDWQPRTTAFSYLGPADISTPLKFYGGKVLFDQPKNFIEFDSDILDTRISEADPRLMAVLLPQANQLVENLFARPDLVNQVRMLIMGDLDSGRMDSDSAARALNMSRASLYRRLKEENTSFQVIKNEIVEGLAKQALRETDSPISQIALMLGYSEHSAFVHSFTKLAGMSPSTYRAG
jgi:AraC-like DNA-binding protein